MQQFDEELPRRPSARRLEYQRWGIVGPVHLFSTEEMAELRQKFYETAKLDEAAPKVKSATLSLWHWFEPWMADLVRNPRILDVVTELLGEDIAIWNSHFWYKPPQGQKSVPWHQDGAYWGIRPKDGLTAWIAFSDCTLESGCLTIAPSEHRPFIKHNRHEEAPHRNLNNSIPEDAFDRSRLADVPVKAGEALFFDMRLVHCSRPNTTDVGRVALSLRYVPTYVRFTEEGWTASPERVRLMLVRGVDRYRLNDHLYGPPPGMTAIAQRPGQ